MLTYKRYIQLCVLNATNKHEKYFTNAFERLLYDVKQLFFRNYVFNSSPLTAYTS